MNGPDTRRPRPSPATPAPDGRTLDTVLSCLELGEPVEVVAGCGFGKSTLLRTVATELRGDPDVIVATAGSTMADTVRRLATRLPSRPREAVPLARSAAALRAAAATILVDDVGWSARDVTTFLALTRGCRVVLATDRPLVGAAGRSIRLPGLDVDTAAGLVGARLGSELAPEELPHLAALVQKTKGRPLSVHQVAEVLADPRRSMTIEDLARRSGPGGRHLDVLAADGLTPGEATTLKCFWLLAGAVLPADLVGLVADVDDVVSGCEELAGRGLLTRTDDRYGLPVCRTRGHRRLAVDGLVIGRAAQVVAEALTSGRATDDLELAQAAVSLAREAADHGGLDAVVTLADAADPVLTLAGCWDAARDLVAEAADAAHRLDRATERRLRDRERELAELEPAVPGDPWWVRLRQHVRRPAAVVGLTAAGLAAATGIVTAIADVVPYPPPPPPPQTTGLRAAPASVDFGGVVVGTASAAVEITLRNTGTRDLENLDLRLAPDQPSVTVSADRCTAEPLPADRACHVTVRFSPTAAGAVTTSLVVTGGGGPLAQIPVTGRGRARPPTGDPVLTLVSDLVREATSPRGAAVTYEATARDAAGKRLDPRCAPASGRIFPLRTTTVVCTPNDAAGRTTRGSFTITVLDTTPPVITVSPTTFEADDAKGAHHPRYEVNATDIVSSNVVPECNGPTSGESLPFDDTVLECTATDAADNTATERLTLHVVDTTPPAFENLPTTAVMYQGGPLPDFTQYTALDAVDGQRTVECTPPADPEAGHHDVPCTTSDTRGNTATEFVDLEVRKQVE